MTAAEHYWGVAGPGMVDDVWDERKRQIEKWGEQHHPDGTGHKFAADLAQHYKDINGEKAKDWAHILLEEFYEALAESEPVKLRAELVQVAAVVASWIEDIDSRNYIELNFTQLELPFEEAANA